MYIIYNIIYNINYYYMLIDSSTILFIVSFLQPFGKMVKW